MDNYLTRKGVRKINIKETLLDYAKETKVYPPYTIKKIEKAGYVVKDFLIELKNRLENADMTNMKTDKKTLELFFAEVEKMIADK